MTTSTRYFVQYLTSAAQWKASSPRYALTPQEAFAYKAKMEGKLPGSTMRVVKSTMTDGLISQEVVTAA